MRRFILVLAVFLLVVGCCAHPDVEDAIKDGIAVNQGHMLDDGLPVEAHVVAEDNYVFLHQILYGLTGESIPENVQKIIDARKGGGQ